MCAQSHAMRNALWYRKRRALFLRAVGWEGSERAVCMLKIAPVERRRLVGKRIAIPFSL